MNDKVNMRYKRQLRLYVAWPLILSVFVVAMCAGVFAINIRAGLLAAVFTAVYIIFAVFIRFYNKKAILNDLINFATQYGQVQKSLLKGLSLPYAMLDETGRFIWSNNEFDSVIGRDKTFRKPLSAVIPDITKDKLPTGPDPVTIRFSINERDFRADMRCIALNEMAKSSNIVDSENFEGSLVTLFLFEETEINRYIRLNEQQRLVSGYIYMDNYEEALESVEEVRRSLLSALIDRKIYKYFTSIDAVVKNIEKDKYIVVMKKQSFDMLVENRFDILEDVKTVKIGNEMAVTLSMGFGLDTPTFTEDGQYARNAIDLALGRGGDQAVVKTPEKITYYGGKSQQVEKSTRVKARVKAHALKEIIESKDQILVMGHKITDVDTFGAAIGVYRASKQLDKHCHVIINEVTSAIRPLMDSFVNNQDYEPDMFVTNSEAMQLNDSTTALVVVDTNRPSFTECPEIIPLSKTIVVLDHHRQGSETIENATLSYIEPYASSACEMVAEILQYISDNMRIKGVEADCLYSGMMIDTNNFMTKTGVRTFEAAAFLRRNGADVTRVRKLFRNDLSDFKARAEAVRNAELFLGKYAISVCPSEGIESPTIVGAQAANELLNINQVKASFIFTDFQGRIYISARSIDEINVQIIMERLGGGGHLNIAGAQLTEVNVEEAVKKLKETIEEMEKEGAFS